MITNCLEVEAGSYINPENGKKKNSHFTWLPICCIMLQKVIVLW